MLEVTDVRIRTHLSAGRCKAIVSIVLAGEFAVHGVRIIEGSNGLFVAMPSEKMPTGEFRDVAHPITSEARECIQAAVLEAYTEALALKAS